MLSGNSVHFYEKHSRGYDDGRWDTQKIDMGIALCHFEVAAMELGIPVSFTISDPGLATAEDIEYIASFEILE